MTYVLHPKVARGMTKNGVPAGDRVILDTVLAAVRDTADPNGYTTGEILARYLNATARLPGDSEFRAQGIGVTWCAQLYALGLVWVGKPPRNPRRQPRVLDIRTMNASIATAEHGANHYRITQAGLNRLAVLAKRRAVVVDGDLSWLED